MSSSQHKPCAALLALAAGMAGCAGNGEGPNANGLPISSSSGSSGSGSGTGGNPGGSSSGGTSGTVTADSQSIQDNVFTPICSPCHSGTGAPRGLMLVRGTGGGVLADLNAQILGSDYSFTFTVDASP